MAHDVFISHSAKDKPTADAVCAMLESEGIRCWIAPRDVIPGMEWGKSIIEAIEQTRVMVLIFTSHANDSPQIRREIERAANHEVVILPLRIENILPDKSLEYFIGNVHWLDALTPPLETHLKGVAQTIKVLLTRIGSQNAPVAEPPVKSVSPEAKPLDYAVKPPDYAAQPPDYAAKPLYQAATPLDQPAARQAEPYMADRRAGGFAGAAGPGQFGAIGEVASVRDTEGRGTRASGEWQSGGGTVARAGPIKLPVWAWGAAAVLLVGLIFAVVHFSSHPAPGVPASTPTPEIPNSGSIPVQPSVTTTNTPPPTVLPGNPASVQPHFVQASPFDQRSLSTVLSYIQSTMNGIGTASYNVTFRNTSNGVTTQGNFTDQITNVVTNSAQCRIYYHWNEVRNGTTIQNLDTWFALRAVQSVLVESMQQDKTNIDAAEGQAQVVAISASPAMTAVVVRRTDNASHLFPFSNVAVANSFAEAMSHSAKLCGAQ